MAKIPKGYQGTYAKNSNGNSTLVMVSRNIDPTTQNKKGAKNMAEKTFEKWTTEQKKEFGKQFSAKERSSYRKGQENAYRHSANMSGHQAKFLSDSRAKGTQPKGK